MTVSTIFLQTTNEGDNEYGDTTFAIHVPAKDKSYKLSCASFMFRPKIILMENQHITFQVKVFLQTTVPESDMDALYSSRLRKARDNTSTFTLQINQAIAFNPSKTEVTQMKDIVQGTLTIELPYEERPSPNDEWQRKTIKAKYDFSSLTWSETEDYRVKITTHPKRFESSSWLVVPSFECGLNGDQISFLISEMAIVDISPQLRYFSGLEPAPFKQIDSQPFTLIGARAYNPHYWNYITLSCNKSYNTGNVVNQERFNTDIDESSQFYKGQILAYMPNNAYAPEAMQTGMATANEYIIQPADFNSIRFWLNYDNGEPVKLCSPMTIVLNMMPNQ